MRNLIFASVLGLLAPTFVQTAEAADFTKEEGKAFQAQVKAAYPGTIWALKDLPSYTGITMNLPWLGPAVTVEPSGYKADTNVAVSTTYGSAKSLWFGVRPMDTLTLKEVTIDDDVATITLVGTGTSKGHDTKIDIKGTKNLDEVKKVLEELIVTTSPLEANADWSEEVKTAITNRVLVNGMTKRQAYLVVGEPLSSQTQQEGSKKVEYWVPRANYGIRMGYGASVEQTKFPGSLRFEEGKLVGITTGAKGGVSLD